MPHNINIVIPLRDPFKGKQRLQSVLNQAERVQLVLALFRKNISLIKEHFPQQSILVITDSGLVESVANYYGAKVLREQQAKGLTAAVEAATRWSVEHGFHSQLVLAPDLAELDPEELACLLTQPRPQSSVLLCPAKDFGTNAVLTTPPDVIDFWYGRCSYFEFKNRAQRNGVYCRTLELPHMSFDIDTPADMEQWQASARGEAVDEWLDRRVVA